MRQADGRRTRGRRKAQLLLALTDNSPLSPPHTATYCRLVQVYSNHGDKLVSTNPEPGLKSNPPMGGEETERAARPFERLPINRRRINSLDDATLHQVIREKQS